jgi:Subtilase family
MTPTMTQHHTSRTTPRWMFMAVLLSWSFVLPLLLHCPPSDPSHAPKEGIGERWEADESTPDSDLSGDEGEPKARRVEILADLGADAWHREGHRGRGVKVAILDNGFCGYQAHLGQALPARVLVRSFRKDGNLEAKDSQHGILCGEVIHALAPEAELLLANWDTDRPEKFLEAIRWAKAQGARIISCSVIMPTWSDGEGGGRVHESLTKILGRGEQGDDLLMFASAGNTAQRHWGGRFQNDGAGWHDWGQGHKENAIRPWGGEAVSIELCCQSGSRYELLVEDTTAHQTVGRYGSQVNEDRYSCVDRFIPQAGHSYTLKVRHVCGKDGLFHLVALGGGLQYCSRVGSIPFPGDGPEVIAVGAVNRAGQRVAYSSCGANTAIPKPEFVAAIPFPSLWRSRPFTGTSAAAPQAAGLAALVLARHPDWTAHHVRDALRSSVNRVGFHTPSCETGYGQVHLP